MKYCDEIVERICERIRQGDSNLLACKAVGINPDTFYDWKKEKPDFCEQIKKARDEFQATITNRLEATLWKRAMGYEVSETETEYTTDKNGTRRIKAQKTKTKQIQPDTAALIFALTNVAPNKWVNKQKVETSNVEAEPTHDYHFEDLPQDELAQLADKMQEAEHKRVMSKQKRE